MPPMWHSKERAASLHIQSDAEISREESTKSTPAWSGGMMFFIPQMPYVFKGTLVENMVYPFFALFDNPSADDGPEATEDAHDDGDERSEESPLHPHASQPHILRCCCRLLRKRPERMRSCGRGRQGQLGSNVADTVLHSKNVGAERVRQAMEMAGLTALYERYGKGQLFSLRREWDSALSPGEKQRLNFARLFFRLLLRQDEDQEEEEVGETPRTFSNVSGYCQPPLDAVLGTKHIHPMTDHSRRAPWKSAVFAVMDEATSFMDEAMEQYIYEQCMAAGVTIISVGHRGTLRRYHQSLLLLHTAASGTYQAQEQEEGDGSQAFGTLREQGATWGLYSLSTGQMI